MDGITESAGVKLRAVLERAEVPTQKCVRLVDEKNGQMLKVGEPRPGDEMFEYGGRTVLVLDPQMAKKYVGQKLDWQHGQFLFV
jgi:hypothetical protein